LQKKSGTEVPDVKWKDCDVRGVGAFETSRPMPMRKTIHGWTWDGLINRIVQCRYPRPFREGSSKVRGKEVPKEFRLPHTQRARRQAEHTLEHIPALVAVRKPWQEEGTEPARTCTQGPAQADRDLPCCRPGDCPPRETAEPQSHHTGPGMERRPSKRTGCQREHKLWVDNMERRAPQQQ